MPVAFNLTPSASRDLDNIFEYILGREGPVRALHVHDRLHQAFEKVAARPALGHRRDDLADEALRVLGVLSFLVIYRPETTPLQIVRVMHGARDIRRAMQE